MRKLDSTILMALLVVGLALVPTHGLAQPEFIPLDKTCGPAFFPTFCVVDMSGDGKTVLFRDAIWTEEGGMQPISGPALGWEVVALSDDGSIVVGTIGVDYGPLPVRGEAAIWLGGDQWQPLGGLPNTEPCGTFYTSSWGVDGDGSKVVGLAWLSCKGAHAFEWTEATGMVDLGTIVSDRSSRANAVSADGTMVVGWSDSNFGSRLGAYWDMGAEPAWFTPDGSDILAGEAQGVSSDGRFVVGGGYFDVNDPLSYFEPWLWTEETGVVPLGVAKGLRGAIVDGQNIARDVDDAGEVVVGQTTLFQLGEQWAFLWTESEGMSLLQDYLRKYADPETAAMLCPGRTKESPIPCNGWDLWNMAAVSNDGKTLVGTGANPDGIFQAFMVRLP